MTPGAAPAWLISEAQVHGLHAHALEEWGGLSGVRDTNCVERSIGAGFSAGLYRADEDSEPDVLTVAVHVGFYLVQNHCFNDGNKRVGWMALADQLAAVGLDVDASQQEVVAQVTRVAAGESSVDELQEWVAARLVAVPDSPPS